MDVDSLQIVSCLLGHVGLQFMEHSSKEELGMRMGGRWSGEGAEELKLLLCYLTGLGKPVAGYGDPIFIPKFPGEDTEKSFPDSPPEFYHLGSSTCAWIRSHLLYLYH